MKVSVQLLVRSCPTCLFNKVQPYRGAQHVPENGDCPWHTVQVDLVHLHETRAGKEKAIVFYDRFTRDVECFAVKADCSTEDFLNVLIFELLPRHGWMRVLYTDRGSNLISDKARSFYKAMGIELRAADAHMHTAVAGCERFNHTLRELCRAVHFDTGYEWDLVLPLLVFWYKQLVQVSSGFSPFYLNHGREALSPWDIKNGPRAIPTTLTAYVRQQLGAVAR